MSNKISLELTEDESNRIVNWLSQGRINGFYLQEKSIPKAIIKHNEALNLGALTLPIIAILEIAIRNSIYYKLCELFGNDAWLEVSPTYTINGRVLNYWDSNILRQLDTATNHARRENYSKLSNSEKIALDALAFPNGVPTNFGHFKRAKRRQKAIVLTREEILTQLTLGFWKSMFSSDFEDQLWKTALRKLFPNKSITRTMVATWLEDIYLVRNRIAHHENVLAKRIDSFIAATNALSKCFENKENNDTSLLYRLIAPYIDNLTEKRDQFYNK